MFRWYGLFILEGKIRIMFYESTNSVWPVLLTPFKEDGKIDYDSLKSLICWYEENGVGGLFAVCQSSEMFFLSLRERVELTAFIKKTAHVPVISSGHISYDLDDQVDELQRISDAGADAVIMITNRLAGVDDSDAVWRKSLDYLMKKLPQNIPLGFYECPYPYKRLIRDDELKYCAESGRFFFLKDTCCDAELIRHRLELLKDTRLKLYNANTATLLETLTYGAAGFSGVMANFHPELYVWLCKNWKTQPQKAERLQALLTMCAQIERQLYPVNAKTFLQSKKLIASNRCRSKNCHEMSSLFLKEVEQMEILTSWFEGTL